MLLQLVLIKDMFPQLVLLKVMLLRLVLNTVMLLQQLPLHVIARAVEQKREDE